MASLLSLVENAKGSSVYKENGRGSLYLYVAWVTLTGAAVGTGGKEDTARAKQGTVIQGSRKMRWPFPPLHSGFIIDMGLL